MCRCCSFARSCWPRTCLVAAVVGDIRIRNRNRPSRLTASCRHPEMRSTPIPGDRRSDQPLWTTMPIDPPLLPGAVVDGVLVGRAGGNQAPVAGPFVGVLEALARVGLGRGVEDSRELEILQLDQAAGLFDEIVGVLRRVLLDRLVRPRPRRRTSSCSVAPSSSSPAASLRVECDSMSTRRPCFSATLIHGSIRLMAATSPRFSASMRSRIVPANVVLICSRFRKPSSSLRVVKCEPLNGLTPIGLVLQLLGLEDARFRVGDEREASTSPSPARRSWPDGGPPGLATRPRAS